MFYNVPLVYRKTKERKFILKFISSFLRLNFSSKITVAFFRNHEPRIQARVTLGSLEIGNRFFHNQLTRLS